MMEAAVVKKWKVFWVVTSISILYALFSISHAQTSKAQFEVVVAGFNIGQVNAEEIKAGEKTQYNIVSEVSFWFFGKVELAVTLHNIFQNSILIESKSHSKTNRGSYHSYINWSGNQYEVNSTTYKFENNKPIEGPISRTSASFYFDEPKDGDQMLSETYGLVSKVNEKTVGVYEVNINGNRNQYHYINGELDKIQIQNPVKNFVVRRVR